MATCASATVGLGKGENKKIQTELPGVFQIELDLHQDDRGFFVELFRASYYQEVGIQAPFVQNNFSMSKRNTVRGLHYQIPSLQGKLCSVLFGEVLDVVLDIRRGSPTFGKWMSLILSSENGRQLYLPGGLAHGFHVISESACFLYQCDAEYDPKGQREIRGNDPNLGILWDAQSPVLSDRDARLPLLKDVPAEWLPTFSAVDGYTWPGRYFPPLGDLIATQAWLLLCQTKDRDPP